MFPPSHPLIEAATKPLAENTEQHLAAKAMLEETFNPTHPEVPATLARFKSIDTARFSSFWRWLLPVVATLCLLAIGIAMAPRIKAILALYSYVSYNYMDSPPVSLSKSLTAEEMILIGDPRKTALQQKEQLIRSAPDRPDFYADYLTAYINEFDHLPGDYFETIERIDPDNAYFLYIAAAVIGKDSVKKVSVPWAERKNNKSTRYEIVDDAGLKEAMELFRRAGSLPRFDSYVTSMLAARIPLLKQGNLTERIQSIAYIAGHPAASINFRYLADAMSAAVARSATQGDAVEFNELLKDNENFLKLWGESPVGWLVDELVFSVCAIATTNAFCEAATKLGLEEKNKELFERKKRVDARTEWRKGKRPGHEWADAVVQRGGTMLGTALPMVARQVEKPMPVSIEELRPGRLLDHEITSQLFVAMSCVILLLAAAVVYLFRFRAPFHARRIADRMSRLLGKDDWAWILLGGVVLPFTFIILINRGTPLGGREYGLKGMGLVFPTVHYVLLTIALVAMPVLFIRSRLYSRSAPFGIATRKSRIGWPLPVLGLAAAVGSFPFIRRFGMGETELLVIVAVPALWLLALIITSCRALLGRKHLRISRAAAANALIPAYALGIILLAFLYPLLVSSERKLSAEDSLLKLDPKFPGMTPYEYKVTVQLRKEINEMIGHPLSE